MKISLKVTDPSKQEKTCVIIGVYEDHSLTPAAKIIDKISDGQLKKLLKKNVFQGKTGQTLPLFNLGAEAVLLVGCGKNQAMTAGTFRKIIKSGLGAALATSPEVTCFLTELDVDQHDLAWKVKHVAEIASESIYRFENFKKEKQDPIMLKEFILPIPSKDELKSCELALKQALAIASGVSFTKDLANSPSNICTPTYLADQAKQLGKTYKTISVQVIEEKEMAKLGMGALLGVTKGSAENAKLITLEYYGGKKKTAPIVLVGKGITFDTGGISLKPADSMVGMKYDMCGAATVLGTLKAAAELKLPINLIGVVAAAENMPGGAAYKPEDILTSMSGQTIEIISTDAEGRLVLCDALTYSERFKPKIVIDIATLTGAVVVALGHHATGLLSNDEPLTQDLVKAGTESFDRVWPLPLWEEYQEQIKSPFADMANLGGRSAGTITAACFLSRFTKSFRWAHLDVAGTAAMMAGVSERKATGRPVPLLMQYLIGQAEK